MGKGVVRGLLFGAVAAAGLLLLWLPRGPRLAAADPAGAKADPADAGQETDPMGANAACYVCHIPFVKEELGKVHLVAEVACVKCHGLSSGHANDEDIGATPPDVVFKRDRVDAMCVECHDTHDAPAKDVVARFLERRLLPRSALVCTDCHGRHKIQRPEEE